MFDRITRQSWGCAYEPKHPTIEVDAWSPRALDKRTTGGWSGKPPEVCPGYTCSLPEVIEIARARFWKGSLRDFCANDTPTDLLQEGVEIFEGACNQVDGWRMVPSKDGGGAA